MAKRKKVSPDIEEQRKAAQARILQAEEAAHREYEAAKRSRRTFHWTPRSLNGNRELLKSLPLLQRRHQDLVTNNAWAKRAIDVIVNSWISTGMLGHVTGGGKRLSAAWEKWAETTACDFYGQSNLYDLQRLWARMVAVRGSVLIHRVIEPRPGGQIGLSLQTLDPALLVTSPTHPSVKLKDGEFTLGGKIFDRHGRVVRYLIENPADELRGTTAMGKLQPLEIDAKDMIHLYRMEFPGQVTGIPWGVAAMIRARDLDDYESTELLKQKLAACYAAFRVTLDPDDPTLAGEPEIEDIEPGTVKKLAPGEDIRFAVPPPVGSYDVFLRHNQRAMAMAWGVTFEAMTGNLSEVNYSSARMGHLQFEKSVKSWRQMMRVQALQRIVEWVNDDPNTGTRTGADLAIRWGEPRAEIFDPGKEVEADIKKVQAGFVPLSEIQAAYGNDPAWTMDELEKNLKDARGRELMLSVDGKTEQKAEDESSGGGKDAAAGGGSDDSSQRLPGPGSGSSSGDD